MDLPPSDFRLLRYASDWIAPPKRLEAWRSILSRKLLKAEIATLPGQPFQVDASLRLLPGVRFGVGLFGASISRRTRAIADADGQGFILVVNLEGEFRVCGPDGEFALKEGEGYFIACSEEATFIRPTPGRLLCARFDGAPLAEIVPALGACSGRVISRDCEALRLAVVYMRSLDDTQGLDEPELRRLVVAHIFDLVSLALSSLSAHRAAAETGRTAARLGAIKRYISENLGNCRFSVTDAARHHHLSPRQVQRLFGAAGTTFSEYLLSKRLEHVHVALTDPRRAHRGIGDIALGLGFGDVSHFNRVFRRRFGIPPSAVRSAASARTA